MDEEEIEKAVIAYLKKKGYKQTELAFQEEQLHQHPKYSTADNDIAKQILSFSDTSCFVSSVQSLSIVSWILWRKGHIQEARAFFNSFHEDHEMMHLRDLQKLECVLSPSHLEEMDFAHSLRQSKVNIKICQYSYDLLPQYLHKTQSITMIGVINEHINFQVSPRQPISISDDAEVVTLVGRGQHAANLINQKEINWGLLEDSLEKRLENAGVCVQIQKRWKEEPKKGN